MFETNFSYFMYYHLLWHYKKESNCTSLQMLSLSKHVKPQDKTHGILVYSISLEHEQISFTKHLTLLLKCRCIIINSILFFISVYHQEIVILQLFYLCVTPKCGHQRPQLLLAPINHSFMLTSQHQIT